MYYLRVIYICYQKKIQGFLLDNYSELYPDKFDFKWAFCRYFWESHPLLPDIPIELLDRWNNQFILHCQYTSNRIL